MINIINPDLMSHYQLGLEKVNNLARRIRNLDVYMDALEDLGFDRLEQTRQAIETRLDQIDPSRIDRVQYGPGIIGAIKKVFDQCTKAILVSLFPKEMKDLKRKLEEVDQVARELDDYKNKVVNLLKKEQEEILSIDESEPDNKDSSTSSTESLLSSATSLVYSWTAYVGSFFTGGSGSSTAVEQEALSKPITDSQAPALVDSKNDDLQTNLSIVKQLFKNVAYEGIGDNDAKLMKVQEKIFEYLFASNEIESIVYDQEKGSFTLSYKKEREINFSAWPLKVTAALPKTPEISIADGKIVFLGDQVPSANIIFTKRTFNWIGFEGDKMLIGKDDSYAIVEEKQILNKLKSVFGKEEIE